MMKESTVLNGIMVDGRVFDKLNLNVHAKMIMLTVQYLQQRNKTGSSVAMIAEYSGMTIQEVEDNFIDALQGNLSLY